MKLLHIYDHTYYYKNGEYYSSGVFGAKAWEPYLMHFDSVTVLANLSDDANPDVSKFDVSSRDGVDFLFVDNKRLLPNYLKSYVVDDAKLVKVITEYDAIAVRLPSELGLFAISIAKKLKKPYAVEVVGCAWDSYWYHGSLKGKLMAQITFSRMKKAMKEAPFAIYVTEQFLQKRYPSNGFTANASNVILPDTLTPDIADAHVEMLKQPKDKLKLGLVGTLNVNYKGHEEAILALKEVLNDIPPFELLFIGKGDTTWLEGVINQNNMQDHVKILGKLSSGKAVFDFLDSLDLYLHPSKHEGLPRAVIEAMSRACPVLASTIAGTPELLPAQYLHEPGDHKKLAVQIKEVLNNTGMLCEMALENFERSKAYTYTEIKRKKSNFWKKYKDHVIASK